MQATPPPPPQQTPQYLQINYGNTGTISRRESLLSPSAGRREKQLRCIVGKYFFFCVVCLFVHRSICCALFRMDIFFSIFIAHTFIF